MYFLLLLLLSTYTFAQDFLGKATYISKVVRTDELQIEGSEINDAMRKQIEAQLKKVSEKTFVLNFNKYESVYQEQQRLETPQPTSGMRMVYLNSNDAKRYKNLKNNIEILEQDFLGKEFLVSDSLQKFKWKIDQETKKIGYYLCSKATAILPVSDADKKEYDDYLKGKNTKKTTFLSMSEPKEELISAWFTTEIPVSHGPEGFWGLPGLILEVNDGNKIFLCSEIIINPKDKQEIKLPVAGKKVSRSEYDAIVKQKLQSLQDSNGAIKLNID